MDNKTCKGKSKDLDIKGFVRFYLVNLTKWLSLISSTPVMNFFMFVRMACEVFDIPHMSGNKN